MESTELYITVFRVGLGKLRKYYLIYLLKSSQALGLILWELFYLKDYLIFWLFRVSYFSENKNRLLRLKCLLF